MLTALDANAPDGVSWSHPAGGYFVGSSSTARMPRRSRQMRSGRASRSFPGRASSPRAPVWAASARFAYSYETPERITAGVERVMQLLG